MFKRAIAVLTLSLLTTSTTQAQNLEGLIEQYKAQYQDRRLPRLPGHLGGSLSESLRGRAAPAGAVLDQKMTETLEGLKTLGLLRNQQASGLLRAYRNAPLKTTAMVGEIRRFATLIKTSKEFDQLRCQLGSSWRARRAQRLWLQGASNVLGMIARRGGQQPEIDTTLPALPEVRAPLARYGSRHNQSVRIPLASLVLEVHGRGTFNILSRSAEPLVMTRTDPIYLTQAMIQANRPAASWRKPICVYHFPKHGWSFIGLARTATGRINTLLVTDGARTLILTGMNGPLKEIKASCRPFANQAVALLTRTPGVEHLTYRNKRLVPAKPRLALTTWRAGKTLDREVLRYDTALHLRRWISLGLGQLTHFSETTYRYCEAGMTSGRLLLRTGRQKPRPS